VHTENIAQMSDEEIAAVLVAAAEHGSRSPAARAMYKEALREARDVRGWRLVPSAPSAVRDWITDMVADYNILHRQVCFFASTGFHTDRPAPGLDEDQAARHYAAAKADRDSLMGPIVGACDAAFLSVWHAADWSLATR